MAKQQLNNRVFGSEYMHWAKTSSAARFNLATSGLANRNLKEIDVSLSELEITTEYGYGYPPLKYGLAERLQVPTESIVTAAGTTFANHLAMAALIDPGDEVIIEQPTYEPLLALARYLGAEVRRVPRRFEAVFQIDLDELEHSISSRTRLIVLTNLHNPSGVQISNDTLKQVGEIAKRVGARVLVDEVYLESFFEDRPRTAFHLGPEFIVTSSLTKAFGLSGLRCGWIVAEESLAQRMWLLNDLFASTPVHVGERLSVAALHQLDCLAAEAGALLKTNRELVGHFLDSRTDLEAVRPNAGTVVFPRLVRGNSDAFCSLLARKYETSVVPGRFFEMPQHFRLGMGGDTETLEAGLERLGQALDEI
jgi:aspartate/methionine/tyrosine aminotransferase